MVAKSITDSMRLAVLWMSGSANRYRVRGARVEVCVFLGARKPEPSILVSLSPYGDWGMPQEGVKCSETLDDAFWRCLRDELAVEFDPETRGRIMHLRAIQRLGTLRLPPERVGERLVCDDAGDTPLSNIILRRKAYWSACAVLHRQEDVAPVPNGSELCEVRWLPLDEARQLIFDTSREVKALLLDKGLERMHLALFGVRRPAITTGLP